MGHFYQGIYPVKHKEKYLSNKPPVYRSSWEYKFSRFLDLNVNVVQWASEYDKTVVKYKWPDGSEHRYIPDYYVEMRLKDGRIRKFLIEVKPSSESPRHCPPPKEPKRKTSKSLARFRKARETYAKNALKWAAAEAFCQRYGMTFLVITEKEAKKGFIGK
jgi:hypothetical protein